MISGDSAEYKLATALQRLSSVNKDHFSDAQFQAAQLSLIAGYAVLDSLRYHNDASDTSSTYSTATSEEDSESGDGTYELIKASASSPIKGSKMVDNWLNGLDRKKMEEERQARLTRKRERSISPPPMRESRKAPKLDESTVSLPSGAKLTSFSTLVNDDQKTRKSEAAHAASQQLKQPQTVSNEASESAQATNPSSSPTYFQYPNGSVKRTWAFGFERTGDDVKLEEVLEPHTLRTAVLSAFQWDDQWMLDKLKTPLNGGTTKCVFIMQAKEGNYRQELMKESEGARAFLRLCLPSMDGVINCMHSKLMLLFHPHKLRIAIPTANLLNFDWGETGVMENSVWMIDLPRLPDTGSAKATELNAFCSELLYYIEKQGLNEDVRDGVLNFDFTATDEMMFVHTVGGSHSGEDARRTGLPGLARAVRQLNLQTDNGLQIDFAASSIGALNDDQLRNMHAAARGEDMIQRANGVATKAQSDFFKPSSSKSSTGEGGIRDKMRIYFPTHDTVTSSIAGAAGTICLSRKWWEEMRFPRSCFRDYQSTRAGLLSHNKILYARGKQSTADGGKKDIAWAYVGSANMSESAWGKLLYDKKLKDWKINCRNWECGVILPVPADELANWRQGTADDNVKRDKIPGDDSETESEDDGETAKSTSPAVDVVGMEVFDGIVRPPFMVPGHTYDGREPWYFQEYQ